MTGSEQGGEPRTLGAALAQARERAGLDIEQVAARTNIRGTLIRGIENDDFAACGGAVYARGHIRSIGKVVGIDPEPLVAEFDRRYGSPVEPPTAVVAQLEPDQAARREFKARRGANWTLAAVVALLIIIAFAAVDLIHGHHPSHVAGGPAVHHHHPTPTPTKTTTKPPPLIADAGVNVVVHVVSQPSWFSVANQQGTVLFQGDLGPGAVRAFHATQKLSFDIGNAGAVMFTVNGRHIGALGGLGAVVNRTFLAVASNQA